MSTNDVVSLERGSQVATLEDGLSTNNELKEGIRNEQIVRLVSPNGHSVVCVWLFV